MAEERKERAAMAQYNGRSWTRRELLSWVGSVEQLAGARRAVLAGGKAEGVEAVEVSSGGGLRFTVLPGRGMDIAQATFRDIPLAFFSGTGITSPAYYEEPGLGWLRGFYGGLLTTCGIANCGAPSTDEGEPYGLHGRVANAAAEDLCTEQTWEGDEYVIRLRGTVRESKAMFENLRLTRRITTCLGSTSLEIHDTIENVGFEPQPLMMLYHFNFGWPLLSTSSRIVGPFVESLPRDEESAGGRGLPEALGYPAPVPGYAEKVFYHTLGAAKDGRTAVALLNDDCGGSKLGMVMRLNRTQLGCFTQWKMPRQGFYVLGLEPGTVYPDGRAKTRELGKLPVIEAFGRHEVDISIEVVEGRKGLEEAEKLVAGYRRS
jgi:hypothetical protein